MNARNMPPSSGGRVLRGTFSRHLEARGRVTFRSGQESALPEPVRGPARVARVVALAHHLQDAINSGRLTDQSSAARALSLTKARITQVLDLLLLAPVIQEEVLHLEALDGVEPMPERWLRDVLRVGPAWRDQILAWHRIRERIRVASTRRRAMAG